MVYPLPTPLGRHAFMMNKLKFILAECHHRPQMVTPYKHGRDGFVDFAAGGLGCAVDLGVVDFLVDEALIGGSIAEKGVSKLEVEKAVKKPLLGVAKRI